MKEKLYCLKISFISGDMDCAEKAFIESELKFSTWLDVERKSIEHIFYADDPKSAVETALKINIIGKDLRKKNIRISKPKLEVLKKEDWAEAWKKHFKVQHVTRRVVIKPSWLKYTAKKGEVIIEIDPGMSFGTGKHATTRFCLKMLDRIAKETDVSKMTVLDAGCGSGILSIGAVRLGFSKITAFDFDPESVVIAKENFDINKISRSKASVADAELSMFKAPEKFDIVVANIISDILIVNCEKLDSLLRPDGYLVLAGILSTDYSKVRKAFKSIGFKEIHKSSENEWTGGMFRRN
ncbi:MAG: ribosomal protein L11 methyltransferase [Lentisphaerae bacterium GWF2_50_93]|nr:MAG: ribosomal protein L11 methyltransferase [Lentisphaerae bacterium GWF2_50_93]